MRYGRTWLFQKDYLPVCTSDLKKVAYTNSLAFGVNIPSRFLSRMKYFFELGGVNTAGEDILKRLKVRNSCDEYIRRKINFHQLKLTLSEFLFCSWLYQGDFRTVRYVRVHRAIYAIYAIRLACVPAAVTKRQIEILLKMVSIFPFGRLLHRLCVIS